MNESSILVQISPTNMMKTIPSNTVKSKGSNQFQTHQISNSLIQFEFKFCMQNQENPFIQAAIPMVSVDDKTGKYVLTSKAVKFLRAIDGPIAVISVAGLYRTGKSYLLNRVMLNQSNGFGVGPTVNPCTKGLWCWGTPLKGTSSEGESVNIIVIDTEGIGALDEDQTHDTKIFTLAILASSCFVYNSVGSIDETAIQNLSLVVNLTKHIQLKASDNSEDDEDPDEIASYFPTFFWVVRDFSLQLQDPEGNSINSKEYLERALAPQNGFSDDIEEKNRIRRLLTAFFKDRDCITMIRPLVDETKLQNLDKMDFKELRQDFVEQAKSFRKRLMGSIKVKTLHDQKLNGELYCSMMNSYVAAINDGAVPNIENAWNYMCEEQCRRTMEESYKVYIQYIQTHLKDLPKPEEDFMLHTTEAEEKALDYYREHAMGSKAPTLLQQLKASIKTQFDQMKEKNIKDSNQVLKQYIFRNVAIITKKLNNQNYSTYSEFDKELSAMYEKITKEGPKLHNYKFTYAQAVRKLSAQGAEFLFKSFTKQQEKALEMFKQKEKQMVGEIQNMKTECEGLRKKYNETAMSADQKIMELTNREENIKKQLQMTLQAKKDEENKMQRYYGSKESEIKANMRALEQKYTEVTNRLDEANKQFLLDQQSWAKEKAVFEQQAKFQQLQIEQLQKKERSLEANINLNKTNMSKEVRDITMRLETDRDNIKMQLESKIEKVNELTEELSTLKEELTDKTDKFDKKEKKFKEDMANWKRDSDKARKELQMEKKQLRDELTAQESTLREEFQMTDAKYRESERALKELSEKFRTTKNDLEKQRSLLEQEMSFIKQENDSLRSKVTQLKEAHDMALASYQASMSQESQESMSRRIIEIQNEHTMEIDRQTNGFNAERNRMNCEFTNLTTKHFELETRYNAYRTQKDLEQKEFKSVIEELRCTITALTNEKNRMETEFLDELALKEEQFYEEKSALTRELDQVKATSQMNIDKITEGSQYDIERVRMMANEEIAAMKKKQREQKEKIDKRHKEEMEEYERTAEEVRLELEDKNEELQRELSMVQEHLKTITFDLQKNNEIKDKEISKLHNEIGKLDGEKKMLKTEFEEEFKRLSAENEASIEKLGLKIDQLSLELTEASKERVALTSERNNLASSLEKAEGNIAKLTANLKTTEEKAKVDLEQLNLKYKKDENQAMEKYSNLSKENALLTQKLDFQDRHTKEIEAATSKALEMSEKKFETYRTEKETELKNMSIKLINEKTQIDNKYQQLKTTYKEQQNGLKKNLSQVLKNYAVLEEKNNHLETKLLENQSGRTEEVANLRSELSKAREALASKEKDIKQAVFSLNARIAALESEKSELMSTLDKERSLAEQSASMFNKIKEENKREAEERIKTLEQQLNREQNNRLLEKNTLDSTHSRTIGEFDRRFREKMHELNEALNKTRHQLELTTKEKDATIKELTEKYQTEKTTRTANNNNFERRISELTAAAKLQQEEIDRLKKNRFTKEEDRARKEAEEKDALRRRLEQAETNFKDREDKLKTRMNDLDRQRYAWNYEKEMMQEKITQLEDDKEKLAKQVSRLNQDKERLKNSKPAAKNTSYIGGLKTTLDSTKIEKSVVQEYNKENTSFQ